MRRASSRPVRAPSASSTPMIGVIASAQRVGHHRVQDRQVLQRRPGAGHPVSRPSKRISRPRESSAKSSAGRGQREHHRGCGAATRPARPPGRPAANRRRRSPRWGSWPSRGLACGVAGERLPRRTRRTRPGRCGSRGSAGRAPGTRRARRTGRTAGTPAAAPATAAATARPARKGRARRAGPARPRASTATTTPSPIAVISRISRLRKACQTITSPSRTPLRSQRPRFGAAAACARRSAAPRTG